MIKFISMIIFMNFMIMMNGMLMFYSNLCGGVSLMLMFMFMMKDLLWFNISMGMSCNCYSIMLVLLSVWIVMLMMMSLQGLSKVKVLMFINMLVVLVMFFLMMDLTLFYLMFEVSLIPTFFLIIYWGSNPERFSAAFYLMIYMMLISFPLLVYIFDMYHYSMTMKFSLMAGFMENYTFSIWGFLMIYMSFYIKIPMYFFHVWLPKAHVEAPVYGSMILAGILLKMGGYGVIRFSELLYKMTLMYSSWIFSIGVIGSVVTSLVCLVQIDMKSLVAYSSVVHMNMMLCSLMTMYKIGVLGSYVMMISHGLCSSGMFYMVNLFYERTGSRLLLFNKGMVGYLPSLFMWWFMFCVMNFSFPLSLNFISEVLVLMVVLNWSMKLLIYLVVFCFFSGAYSLYLFSYVYHGSSMYYGGKFGGCFMKEYIVIIMHFFPLLMYLLNLVVFL